MLFELAGGAGHQLQKRKDKLRFSEFGVEGKNPSFNVDDYLNVLEKILPLREPTNKATFYKIFVRTLAHEWEEAVEPKKLNGDPSTLAFSWIMKMTRNWIAHNSTAIFNSLSEKDVAYLFICNMRAMFDLGAEINEYEEALFSLFNVDEKAKNLVKEKSIPLVEYYVKYFNENTKRTQVHHILHDLQNNKSILEEKGDNFFITGLYHSFWYLTSEHNAKKDKAVENRNDRNQVYISRYYTFNFFDYSQSEFLFKLSSHIYRRSFPQGT